MSTRQKQTYLFIHEGPGRVKAVALFESQEAACRFIGCPHPRGAVLPYRQRKTIAVYGDNQAAYHISTAQSLEEATKEAERRSLEAEAFTAFVSIHMGNATDNLLRKVVAEFPRREVRGKKPRSLKKKKEAGDGIVRLLQ